MSPIQQLNSGFLKKEKSAPFRFYDHRTAILLFSTHLQFFINQVHARIVAPYSSTILTSTCPPSNPHLHSTINNITSVPYCYSHKNCCHSCNYFITTSMITSCHHCYNSLEQFDFPFKECLKLDT